MTNAEATLCLYKVTNEYALKVKGKMFFTLGDTEQEALAQVVRLENCQPCDIAVTGTREVEVWRRKVAQEA
ncbi:hypothetical protein GCM10011450_02350 [Advenella faeciporci]|uniref:Uncharacterized protein n=1 Tax=Advenella faeciporci TaxID=797535 RepID=A0A918JEG1_9BURK|nr:MULTISPECIES: hypothetical protein [Advenella]MDD3757327.1 hypothetical protein [Advenella sp.]GGW76256.1 hypothetical protein GCM10011450_02350 [Advenella faeciporci]